MPHLRSRKARLRRTVKQLILDSSFRDPEMAETISTINETLARRLLSNRFPWREYYDPIEVEVGTVLLDARGRGVLQQLPLGVR